MLIEMNHIGRHVGTQFAGDTLRGKIINAFDKGEPVTIDFSGVQSISAPFADECFGKLMDQYDFSLLKQKIKFINTPPDIESVIYYSLKQKMRPLVNPKQSGQVLVY